MLVGSKAASVAIQGTKAGKKGAGELVSSKSEAGMSDADVTCYAERYQDLGDLEPREHYLTKGKDEGRQANCALELTDYRAQRYLDRYPDLQHSIGRSGRSARAQAKQHYIDIGYGEKRDVAVPKWDDIWLCGTTGSSSDSSCKCKGNVYYGYLEAPDS